MKDGFYLSTYLYINDLAYLTEIELRHDMNVSLWKKSGNNIELVKYWELERVTGLKQHKRAFYDKEHANSVINQLLSEFHLTINDMNEVWGTPELDTNSDYNSLVDYNQYCYHSVCHLFSSLLMDTDIFYNENILSLAVDGAPDNLLDQHIENKFYYMGSISEKGVIKDLFPIASPGIHWGFIRDYFGMREGTLMALGTASNSKLLCDKLDLILPKDKDGVSQVIDNLTELIEYVDKLCEQDVGVLFNGFDPNYSIEENRISMVVKEVQRISQIIMCKNIDYAIKTYGIDPRETYLALSGGFVLNCPTNSYIMGKYKFKNLLATPCVNDAGMSLGVALYAFYKWLQGNMHFKLKNAYYGNSDDKFDCFQEKYKQYIESVEDASLSQIVSDLIENPIIWFQGNAEIGPRALGNRSLLADPRSVRSKDILNKIKQRQWWRPVAPVVLEEYVDEWFKDSYKSPFMLNTFYIKKGKASLVPAVLHIDGSARVQTVSKEDNKWLYEVVQAFKEKTGIPIICNTSLNDKSEPIINNLDELFNFAINKRINIAYINGKRVKFIEQNGEIALGVKQRPIDFNKYLSDEEKRLLLEKLNPYHIDKEMITVYIQNPKLYKKIDLKEQSSVRMLQGVLKMRMNRYHIL